MVTYTCVQQFPIRISSFVKVNVKIPAHVQCIHSVNTAVHLFLVNQVAVQCLSRPPDI